MKKIVIVGGGAGRLEMATRAGAWLGRKKKAKITLVNRNHSHLWKPLLHEVATGSLDEGVDALSYLAHARNHGFQFQLGSVIDIDGEAKNNHYCNCAMRKVNCWFRERKIAYDTWVMAGRVAPLTISIRQVSKRTAFSSITRPARRFHQEMLNLFLKCSANLGTNGKVNIAIVGGGATGVNFPLNCTTRSSN
ncbi:FAD-dependent oxidoreductase [Shigella flexneri]